MNKLGAITNRRATWHRLIQQIRLRRLLLRSYEVESSSVCTLEPPQRYSNSLIAESAVYTRRVHHSSAHLALTSLYFINQVTIRHFYLLTPLVKRIVLADLIFILGLIHYLGAVHGCTRASYLSWTC